MFCQGRLFIYALHDDDGSLPFINFPYQIWVSRLWGLPRSILEFPTRLRHCGTLRRAAISCDLGLAPPLYAPIYLTLSFPLAQSLRASQPVRAWTFL